MQSPIETPEPASLIPESPPTILKLSTMLIWQTTATASVLRDLVYSKYPWLHYKEADDDSVLCFYCLVAEKHGLSSSAAVRNDSTHTFVKTGFSNRKKKLSKDLKSIKAHCPIVMPWIKLYIRIEILMKC